MAIAMHTANLTQNKMVQKEKQFIGVKGKQFLQHTNCQGWLLITACENDHTYFLIPLWSSQWQHD
jgi:hypothetical protein